MKLLCSQYSWAIASFLASLFFLTAHQREIFLLAIYLIRVRRSHGEIGIKSFINFIQYILKTPEKSLVLMCAYLGVLVVHMLFPSTPTCESVFAFLPRFVMLLLNVFSRSLMYPPSIHLDGQYKDTNYKEIKLSHGCFCCVLRKFRRNYSSQQTALREHLRWA